LPMPAATEGPVVELVWATVKETVKETGWG
jgi:hypothetical protein